MASAVLDTSALLAVINGEPGAETVGRIILSAVVSAVNLAEAMTKLVQFSGSPHDAKTLLDALDLQVAEFTRPLAETTGALVIKTRSRGLSMGDRACLALALSLNVPAYTADRSWSGVDVGCDIRLIR